MNYIDYSMEIPKNVFDTTASNRDIGEAQNSLDMVVDSIIGYYK